MRLKHKIYAWSAAITAGSAGLGFLVLPPELRLLLLVGLVVLVIAILVLFAAAKSFGMNVGEFVIFVVSRAVLAVFKVASLLLVELPLRAGHRLWVRYEVPLRVELMAHRFVVRPSARWLRAGFAWCTRGLPTGAEAVAVLRRRPLPEPAQLSPVGQGPQQVASKDSSAA